MFAKKGVIIMKVGKISAKFTINGDKSATRTFDKVSTSMTDNQKKNFVNCYATLLNNGTAVKATYTEYEETEVTLE